MTTINLIPAYRLEARRRLGRLRLWTVMVVVYAVLLTAGAIAARVLLGGADQVLIDELAQVETQVKQTSSQLALLSPKLSEAQVQLRASRAVAAQPNWSTLLVLLGELRGPAIVFDRCLLTPVAGPDDNKGDGGQAAGARVRRSAANAAAKARAKGKDQPSASPSRKPMHFVVEVSGLGRTQRDVSQFVLRLEDLELFDRVKLMETSRRTLLGAEAVVFRIQCALGEGQEIGS